MYSAPISFLIEKSSQYLILNPGTNRPGLAHFVWCVLVPLRTAQQDGQALSPLSKHAFLLR